MNKRVLTFSLVIIMATLMFTFSGCGGSAELSGTYVSVDDSSLRLVFDGKTATLYEGDNQLRSGTYRIQDGALIISFDTGSERYTLDESKETLYHGNYARDNAGEVAFTKEN